LAGLEGPAAVGGGAALRIGLRMGVMDGWVLWAPDLGQLVEVDVGGRAHALRIRQGKGAKDRLVLFTPDLGQLLQVHLGGRARGPLLTSNRGTRLSVRRIQSIVQGVARRAGVAKKISPPRLRHTWATPARNAGLPLDTVQLLLGHESPRTTEIYSRLSMTKAREEYDRAMRGLVAAPGGAASSARGILGSSVTPPSSSQAE